jgi:hypothetical protein
MIQQVEEQHVEEEERFRKLQIQDTANLSDRIDTIIVIIVEYTEFVFYLLTNY